MPRLLKHAQMYTVITNLPPGVLLNTAKAQSKTLFDSSPQTNHDSRADNVQSQEGGVAPTLAVVRRGAS
jgi:hypothetical protein